MDNGRPLPGLRDEILLIHLVQAEEELGPIVKPRQDYVLLTHLNRAIHGTGPSSPN
jgi:hypothetical protein